MLSKVRWPSLPRCTATSWAGCCVQPSAQAGRQASVWLEGVELLADKVNPGAYRDKTTASPAALSLQASCMPCNLQLGDSATFRDQEQRQDKEAVEAT